MRTAEILWPPYPWRAGFCITDDADAATLPGVRGVYDHLAAIGLRTTRTVWPFRPAERCGIPPLPATIQRGITLEDPGVLDYCLALHERGFEICLHGASAGNNVRERTDRALNLMERRFGGARTYVCHAKNAENPYWHERVAPRGPWRWALAPLSRYRCSGEDPASPYFWGDLCFERVRQIRLFRTREIDTLASNPSMPYHDPEKPLVRSWFAATKRSFHDCTAPDALEGLVRGHGLCVLYQYLHRYADPGDGRLDSQFRADTERLMGTTAILVDTAAVLMERLRRIQGVFLAHRGSELWVANANDTAVEELQVRVPLPLRAVPPEASLEDDRLRIRRLPSGGILRIETGEPTVPWPRPIPVDAVGHGSLDFGFGRVFVNAGPQPWTVSPRLRLDAGACSAEFAPGFAAQRPMRKASPAEIHGLLVGQLSIIGHEILWKGRSLSSRRFLSAEHIPLEDHATW